MEAKGSGLLWKKCKTGEDISQPAQRASKKKTLGGEHVKKKKKKKVNFRSEKGVKTGKPERMKNPGKGGEVEMGLIEKEKTIDARNRSSRGKGGESYKGP